MTSLGDLLEGPGDEALVHLGDETWTRAEVRAKADAVAARLAAAGVEPGHAVGVQLPNGVDLVATLFGVWRAGAVYVPLNPRSPPTRSAHVLASVEPAAVVTADGRGRSGHRAPPRAGRRPHPVHLGHHRAGPKPVLLRHAGVLTLLDGVLAKLGWTGRDPDKTPMPNLIPVSLSLWAGLYNVLFALRVGAAVILLSGFDTRRFAEAVTPLRPPVHGPAAGGHDDAGRRRDRSPTSPRCGSCAASPRRCRRCRPAGSRTASASPCSTATARPRSAARSSAGTRRTPGSSARTSSARSVAPTTASQVRVGRRRPGELRVVHPGAQRRLRRRRRPGRPPHRRRLVPHRRRRPGRRRGLRVDRGPGVRHDQPRRPEGLPRRGRGGPAPPPVGRRRRRGRRPRRPPRRGAVGLRREWRGGVRSRRARGPRREHLAPYKVPAGWTQLPELPRNEVGKVLLRELRPD